MKRLTWPGLLVRLAVFSLPVAALFGLAAAVLWRTGELRALDLEDVVARQQASSSELLYGSAYSDCSPRYKLLAANAVRPEVLAVGTSRVMEVRREFFRRPFYNSGGAVFRAGDLRVFLSRISPEGQPRVLLVALDQFALNADVDRAEGNVIENRLSTCPTIPSLIASSWTAVYRDLATRKISRGDLRAPPFEGFGIAAQVNGRGFRKDGSNRPGKNGFSPFSEVLDRIDRQNSRFQRANHPSPELVDQVVAFVDDAAGRGMHVTVFLPPYAPQIRDRMTEVGGYGYVSEIYPALEPQLRARGATLFDFSDVRTMGFTDAAFIDGFHGSERVYAAMVAEMARRDPVFGEVVDVAAIEQMLSASKDPYFVVSGL
jgi:hypothetical protein